MKSLLRQYIQMVVETVDKVEKSVAADKEEDSDEIVEFSGAGAVAGFTAPLGASSEDLQPPKSKRKVRSR